MHIDDAARPLRGKPRALDAHEARQGHQLDAVLVQLPRHGAIEALAVGKVSVGDRRRWDTSVAGDLQPRCRRHIADDADDLGRKIRRLRRLDQRRQVAAAARYQDADLQLRHRLSGWSITQSASLLDAASMAPTK